jgi:glycine/D-amino acid oxidase-like deaminating enzyme/nitrite reductase/ring-hydroxylating ferredoxin subunit
MNAENNGAGSRAPLRADAVADVCIVGAGIAGLSTAYWLATAGRSVVVLDDGAIGAGMTARTTAHLANALDDRYVVIERTHGEEGARIAAESHSAAIARIEEVVTGEQIDCELERLDGYLFLAPTGADPDLLEEELAAAHRAGLADVEVVPNAPLPGLQTGRALRFPRQAQFHPLKYLAGLAQAVERRGGRIFTGTHVAGVEDREPVRLTAVNGRVVTARDAVIATNTPINDRFAIHTKQSPYSTYVIAARVPARTVTRALYWDTEDPYHYVRLAPSPQSAEELLIVGGQDHTSAQADDGAERFERLERWARERFPMMTTVAHRWSGQVMEPADGVAFIGRNPGSEHVFIATGDSGMGMTHGTIAGLLIRDLIVGRDTPWAKLYDPSRRMLRSPLEYAKENLNVAAQFLKGYSGGGDVESVDDIPHGHGALLRRKLGKVAAYRDERGTLHEYSAVCPHLKCIVRWNSVERTWDCPCHGSRFDCLGHVIVGPANVDLQRVEPERHS